MEKFSRDSNISLSFANVNATHLSLGLSISKKLRGKDMNEALLFFLKDWAWKISVLHGQDYKCRGMQVTQEWNNFISCSIFGILHRRRFHLLLARKQTSSFTRSCCWEEFVVHWPIWLFVLNFFCLDFNLIETCSKLMYMYLCSFSLRRSASRLSHDIVSPHYTSWKRGKQRKRSW